MSDWERRMDRERREALEAERLQREVEENEKRRYKPNHDRYVAEKKEELERLAKLLGVSDVMRKVKEVWHFDYRELRKWDNHLAVWGDSFRFIRGKTTGSVELTHALLYSKSRTFDIPGTPERWERGYSSQSITGDMVYTRYDKPKRITAVPSSRVERRVDMAFKIIVGVSSPSEVRWVYAVESFPDSCSTPLPLQTIDDQNIETVKSLLEEAAYLAAKYRRENGLLPDDINKRINALKYSGERL